MLSDFFRINMPYGMHKTKDDEWVCFNREYLPLGYNNDYKLYGFPTGEDKFKHLPIFTKYKGLTNSFLKQIIHEFDLEFHVDENSDIVRLWFYGDESNPLNSNRKPDWEKYFEIIKLFSKLKSVDNS